jgi:hypothetical protein
MSIDVKEAAEKAAEYLRSFYPECRNILIEEVELYDEENVWSITLSYVFDDTGYAFVLNNAPKKFKTFKINATTGQVLSMKMKEVK